MKTIAILLLLASSMPTNGQEKVRRHFAYHALEVSYIGLNAMDLVTTYKVLGAGGRELNPVLAPYIHNKTQAVAFKSVATFAVLGILRIAHRENPKGTLITLAIANVGMGYLVNHNYQVYLTIKL